MMLKTSINHIEAASIINERGKIYDRNGQLLSTNIKSHSLYVNASLVKNKLELSHTLSPIIGLKSEIILQKLNTNKKFVYLKRNISPREHQKIIRIGEINLKTVIEKKRVYPFQNIASHFAGYVDIDNNGKAGIEASYDKELKAGVDIYTTIDINLQNALRNELISTINKYSAESGTIIVMDIKKSELLALNNYPDYDPNNLNYSNLNQRLNRALQSNYEMGSTFKPITVAMGIDNGLIDKDMKFDVSQPITQISYWEPCKCKLNVKEIIVKSSNIGTAKIAKIIGKENQINFFKKIGFYEPVDINLIEAAKPYGQPNNWGKMETMTIGFGHAFAITPMHLAEAYKIILNNGQKTKTKIVLKDNIAISSQIIKKTTSNYVSTLLRAVIQETEYTGPRVKIDGYDIGGKTGTAELTNKGKYDKNLNRTIFVGAFPMSNPKYLILTFIDKPKRKKNRESITSATVNAPLVKKIILRMIEILNITKNQSNKILNAAITSKYNNSNAIN